MERSRELALPSIAIAAEGQEVRGDQRQIRLCMIVYAKLHPVLKETSMSINGSYII